MPTEQSHPVFVDTHVQVDQQQSQIKVCSSCHIPLASDIQLFPHDQTDSVNVCPVCHDRLLAVRSAMGPIDPFGLCIEVEGDFIRRLGVSNEAGALRSPAGLMQDRRSFDEDNEMDASTASSSPTDAESSYRASPPPFATAPQALAFPTKRAISTGTSEATSLPLHLYQYRTQSVPSLIIQTNNSRRSGHLSSSPDPLVDITRLRVRSQGHHCLYPGATFQGTQKSGRNSYDVNVTIVDVDFTTSFLCGYLRIRGLTDDWPELTTYFDAEIIGSRYGFLTQNWGANEQEDLVHWHRFPAFRNVKHELKQPHLTMGDRDRGAVFMRWKERFLVPDHRVQDINGASFAGFYYVCVDFNPQPNTLPSYRPAAQQIPHTRENEVCAAIPPYSQAAKPEALLRDRHEPSVKRGAPASSTTRSGTPVATMSGFYFHQNSEPYQQLSLCHVPERTSSSFEFR